MQYVTPRRAGNKLAAVKISFFCSLFVMAFCWQPLYGAEPFLTSDQWEIRLEPYFFVPSAKANLDIGGLSGPVNLSTSETLKYLDFAAMGRMEAWNGRWGFLFDGLFMDLDVPVDFAGSASDLLLDEAIGTVDFGLSYRLIEQPFNNNRQQIIIEPYAGLRYAWLKQVLNLNLAGSSLSIGHSEDWIEPLVGGRVRWDVSQTVGFDVRADTAGFGIGSASDLSWQIAFLLRYKLRDTTELRVGYWFIDIDYSHGSGADELGIDVRAKGPFIGLTFIF